MNEILELDKNILIYLNNLGSTKYDSFWLFITKQFRWSPLFVFIGYLIQKKIGWKSLGILILVLAALLTCTDQFTEFCKNYFLRLRPCNDETINQLIRV
ncbi:MAG: phosphatase PAP2 family protein, partial [Flavobacterium sp.]